MTDNAVTVWISTYLPSESGSGVERFATTIAEILRNSGYEVRIIDSCSPHVRPKLLSKSRPFAAWSMGRVINRTSKENDVIICNGYFSWNSRRRRSLVVYHGTERARAEHMRNDSGAIRRILVRYVGAYLDKKAGDRRIVVAVSESVKREIEEYYGHQVARVVPNAVDLSLFRPRSDKARIRESFGLPKNKLLILFVGPPDKRKGIDMIVNDICPKLEEDQHFVLRTSIHDTPENATIVEKLSVADLARLYAACDILMLPSDYEGCSITLAEAMASGLPVITSDVGSGSDLKAIPEIAPFIIEDADPRTYLNGISRLARDHERRKRISLATRRFAESYCNPDFFAHDYLQIVDALARRTL